MTDGMVSLRFIIRVGLIYALNLSVKCSLRRSYRLEPPTGCDHRNPAAACFLISM